MLLLFETLVFILNQHDSLDSIQEARNKRTFSPALVLNCVCTEEPLPYSWGWSSHLWEHTDLPAPIDHGKHRLSNHFGKTCRMFTDKWFALFFPQRQIWTHLYSFLCLWLCWKLALCLLNVCERQETAMSKALVSVGFSSPCWLWHFSAFTKHSSWMSGIYFILLNVSYLFL